MAISNDYLLFYHLDLYKITHLIWLLVTVYATYQPTPKIQELDTFQHVDVSVIDECSPS